MPDGLQDMGNMTFMLKQAFGARIVARLVRWGGFMLSLAASDLNATAYYKVRFRLQEHRRFAEQLRRLHM